MLPDHPDQQAMAADDLARLQAIIKSLHPDDLALIRRHAITEVREELETIAGRMLGIIEKVITFCCFPLAWPKIWGVIYALDLYHHEGRSMSKIARTLGATRAAISVHARDFLEMTGLPPSRWMRSEKTVTRSITAREKTKMTGTAETR